MKKQEIETSGPEVEDAISSGLIRLGVSRDQVEVKIIDEGRRGLLGIGGREAVVRLTVVEDPEPEPVAIEALPESKPSQLNIKQSEPAAAPPPVESQPKEVTAPDAVAPAPEETDAAVKLVSELLGLMDVKAAVGSRLTEPDDLTGRQLAIVDIQGEDLNVLIGPRGETLDALQYVSRLMVGHRIQKRAHFVIDVEGYRERREQALSRLAERMAAKAVQRRSPITLEAMPAHERRIIHMSLRDKPDVRTESTGEGKRRRVRIYPK